MEREVEKGGKQELGLRVKKLRGGMMMLVRKRERAGPSTPSPIWRLEECAAPSNSDNNSILAQEFLNIHPTAALSSRKLCASLWEIHPHHRTSLAKMRKPKPAVSMLKSKAFDLPPYVAEPSDSLPHSHQPESASGLRSDRAASLMKHHESVEWNGRALEPASPASHGSSMEVACYNQAVTPTSSLDSRGKLGAPRYNLKTSTELLTVLNRIWSLEEQQVSNMSMFKAMKMELDQSRAKVKKLVLEKQTGRQEMDDLMKQVAEEKVIRKKKEQDRIKAAIQSVRNELEDERKLRKRSEDLHRKLSRELSDMKSSFSNMLSELERERKARILLENLCDEFAKGIRDYEEEVRSLRHKPETDHAHMRNADRLILHISEAWLDERLQMKISEKHSDLPYKNTIVDKLSLDIENFLQAKRFSKSRTDCKLSVNEQTKSHSYHHSRESFPFNEAVSGPQDAVNEEYSTDADLQCFALDKSAKGKHSKSSSKQHGDSARRGYLEELVNSSSGQKIIRSWEKSKGRKISSLQERFNKHMARSKSLFQDWEQGELVGEIEAAKEGSNSKHGGLKSNHIVDDIIRNHSMSSEGEKVHPETDLKKDSCVQSLLKGQDSPLQKWMSKLTSPDFEKSEFSMKVQPGLCKENTLKEKLLEARLEAQRSHSRPSKSSS